MGSYSLSNRERQRHGRLPGKGRKAIHNIVRIGGGCKESKLKHGIGEFGRQDR